MARTINSLALFNSRFKILRLAESQELKYPWSLICDSFKEKYRSEKRE